MRTNAVNALVLLSALVAADAGAVGKGGTLYAKCNPTKALKADKANAAAKATLKVGDEVLWQKAATKPYHEVTLGKDTVYIDQACLSPSKPTAEYASTGGAAISAEAFKSSGAATKGLSQAAITYSNEKGQDKQRTAAQIIYVEENTKLKTDPSNKEYREWAKQAGVNFAAGKVASK